MAKRKAPTRTQLKIEIRKNRIIKALAELAELTKGVEPVEMSVRETQPLLVNYLWTEDFIDEDTGEVVTVEWKTPKIVVGVGKGKQKGILKVL